MTTNNRTKTIALLYGNTGGGHRSAAEAIAEGIRLTYGDCARTVLVDGLRNAPFPVNTIAESYPLMVNYARALYALGFHVSNDRQRLSALRNAVKPMMEPQVEELILQNPADLYVSCHPLFNHIFPRILAKLRSSARYVHVVTDLVSGHVMHYDRDADHIIVPTEEAKRDALANLVAVERITVAGQPVWPDFKSRMGNRAGVRAELGLDDRPVVLLMGGGDGMGRLELVARELMFSKLPVQLVIVCGRNKVLQDNLEFVNPCIPTRIFGFVKNIPELMSASDILITKAGPSSICEGFIAGLPLILFDAVPGQEEGNIDYVLHNGAGAWCPNPRLVRNQVKYLVNDKVEMDVTRKLSRACARPDSATDIAKTLERFLWPG